MENFTQVYWGSETSKEQVKNEGRYSVRQSPTRCRYKSSHQSKSPHKQHHDQRQYSKSHISLVAFQSDTDGSESEFVYHNPPAVTENQDVFP